MSVFCVLSLREQKDPVYLRDKVSQKHSKEHFEVAQKTEQEYSKYFTGLCYTQSTEKPSKLYLYQYYMYLISFMLYITFTSSHVADAK